MKPHDPHPWKARVALMLIYLVLAGLLAWAATVPLSRLTGTLAALIVLGCWVPGYIYVHWADLRSNRVFWISHGIAFVCTAALWIILVPNRVEVDDAIQLHARDRGGWQGIVLGVAAYLVVNLGLRFLINRVFGGLRDTIEQKLNGRS